VRGGLRTAKYWETRRLESLKSEKARLLLSVSRSVMVAMQTGPRSSECRTLTRGRLFLDAAPPYVTAKAGNTKNRKDARQYIQPGLVAELAQHNRTC